MCPKHDCKVKYKQEITQHTHDIKVWGKLFKICGYLHIFSPLIGFNGINIYTNIYWLHKMNHRGECKNNRVFLVVLSEIIFLLDFFIICWYWDNFFLIKLQLGSCRIYIDLYYFLNLLMCTKGIILNVLFRPIWLSSLTSIEISCDHQSFFIVNISNHYFGSKIFLGNFRAKIFIKKGICMDETIAFNNNCIFFMSKYV